MGEVSTPTGRLFRSLRAEGTAADEAVPALSLDEVVGLRSVTLGTGSELPELDAGTAPDLPVLAPPPAPAPAVAAPLAAVPLMQPAMAAAPAPVTEATAEGTDSGLLETADAPPRKPGAHAQRGIGAGSVWIIVVGITVLMAFADALVMGRAGLGWLTGVALLLSSIYAAATVRARDALIAVVAPPLAFFAATLTAGQLTLSGSGDVVVREALMIVTTLGNNAGWIFGATIAALVIVLVRRSISRRQP